jgi:hypothetical protein
LKSLELREIIQVWRSGRRFVVTVKRVPALEAVPSAAASTAGQATPVAATVLKNSLREIIMAAIMRSPAE